MLTQGCLGDLKRGALQLGGSAEAYVSDRVVSKSQTHMPHQWDPMGLGPPFYAVISKMAHSSLSPRERAGGEGPRGSGTKPLTLTLSQREREHGHMSKPEKIV